jgi:Helix-turn-helix domain
MTDKELNQIEEMLFGTGRYKLLDCSRKSLFDLPGGAFKLWHVIYSMESSNQEAYPSLNTLVRVSRMTLNTVIKWKKYLLETGWLIKLEGSAGDRYSEPTNGSWNVPIIRVDDPTKGKSNEKGTAKNEVGVLQKMKPQ